MGPGKLSGYLEGLGHLLQVFRIYLAHWWQEPLRVLNSEQKDHSCHSINFVWACVCILWQIEAMAVQEPVRGLLGEKWWEPELKILKKNFIRNASENITYCRIKCGGKRKRLTQWIKIPLKQSKDHMRKLRFDIRKAKRERKKGRCVSV